MGIDNLDLVKQYVRRIFLDLLIIPFAVYMAWFIRFDGHVPAREWEALTQYVPSMILVYILINLVCGIYRRLWAYASIREAQQEMEDFGEDADLKQAIVDLAVEYGLVTDYTAMVVVRDEVFQAHGIERRNRDRRTLEQAAAQQRALRAAVSRRVDTQQPMYSSNRPGHSGSGALDGWTLLLLLPVAWLAWRRRKVIGHC